MAKPLWFRLFGQSGQTTVAELRDWLLSSPTGDRFGEARLFQQPDRLSERADVASRSLTVPVPVLPTLTAREQANVAEAVATEHALAAGIADDDHRWTPVAPAVDGVAETGEAIVRASRDPVLQETPVMAAGPDGDRDVRLHLDGIVTGPALGGGTVSPIARLDTSTPYAVIGDPFTGLVVDTRNKTLLPGGPGDYEELGAGPNDTIELAGDYSAGFGLRVPDYVEQVIVRAGNDYSLIADDRTVAAGRQLTINAMPLGDANYIMFDGSAETDGSFFFLGSDMADIFFGGGGDDRIYGLGGADVLTGGGGSDIFAWYDATHSSGASYDVLADFDPSTDRLDLDVTVTGFGVAIQGPTLSAASFDADLGAVLGALGAGQAVLFTPGAGDLAGNVFLIVDANGVAGYQAGEDYVFALTGTTLADLAGHTDFFI